MNSHKNKPFPSRSGVRAGRLAALILAAACAGLPAMSVPARAAETVAATDVRTALVNEVIAVAGWHDGFNKLERSLRDRALSDQRIKRMSREAYNTFGLFVRDHLNKKMLLTGAAAHLRDELAGLSDEQLRAYIAAISQPLPQKMQGLERLATVQSELPMLNRYKIGLQRKAPPKARLALVDRYLTASGLREAYLQDQLDELRQMLISAQPGLSDADLKSEMDTLRPELLKKVEFNARADALALYRSVSDEELEAYARLLESPSVADVLTRVTKVSVETSQNAMVAMLNKLAEVAPPTAADKAEIEAANKGAR